MENNETTQQQSSELNYSKPTWWSRSPVQFASLNSILKLIKRWPWLILPGVWVFLIALTAIALFSLTYTGRVQQEEPKPTPVATDNLPETSSQASNPIALWLLGTATLTCAAGYLVIYKRLNSSSRPAKLRERVKRSFTQGLTRRQQRKRLLQESPPVSTPLEPLPPVVPVPTEIEPVVTVVPPEESHPLDSGEESLAEMMDIRKHQSLSSILGNSKSSEEKVPED